MHTYKRELELKHDEAPAKVNVLTGEVTVVQTKVINNGMSNHRLMPIYQKRNPPAWKWLKNRTSSAEYNIADELALMAEAYTSSLKPLNDETTTTALAEMLGVPRKRIMQYIDTLFKLGVIAKFEIYEHNDGLMKYWLFNPFLSFNGAQIKDSVSALFSRTTIAVEFGRYINTKENRMLPNQDTYTNFEECP